MSGPIRLGTFLVSEPFGTGGMGTVWRARHPEGVDVAVKVLKPDAIQQERGGSLLDAFRAEVRSVASLDHPNIVRVFDYGVVPEATAPGVRRQDPEGFAVARDGVRRPGDLGRSAPPGLVPGPSRR